MQQISDIVLKIKAIWKQIGLLIKLILRTGWRNKLTVGLVALLIAVPLTFLLKRDGVVYTGEAKFMLKESSSGPSGVGGILGSIGFGGQDKENYERLLALLKTHTIQRKILTSKYTVDGVEYVVGDRIIEVYKLGDEMWYGNEQFKFADYLDRTDDPKFKKAAFKIGKVLTGTPDMEGIVFISYDRKSFFISISASTLDEDLSIAIINSTYNVLQDFYTREVEVDQQRNYSVLQRKRDSVQQIIQGKEIELARFKDQNRGMILYTDRLKEARLSVEIEMLYEILGQLTTNAAMAEYSLMTNNKGFVILSEPVKPLYYGYRALWKVITFAVLFGLFIALMFTFVRKIFKQPETLDFLNEAK